MLHEDGVLNTRLLKLLLHLVPLLVLGPVGGHALVAAVVGRGQAAVDADRAAEAEEVYRKDLEWNQRNGWTTFGLYQALEAQGKEQEAIIVKRQFDELWRNADVELERSKL